MDSPASEAESSENPSGSQARPPPAKSVAEKEQQPKNLVVEGRPDENALHLDGLRAEGEPLGAALEIPLPDVAETPSSADKDENAAFVERASQAHSAWERALASATASQVVLQNTRRAIIAATAAASPGPSSQAEGETVSAARAFEAAWASRAEARERVRRDKALSEWGLDLDEAAEDDSLPAFANSENRRLQRTLLEMQKQLLELNARMAEKTDRVALMKHHLQQLALDERQLEALAAAKESQVQSERHMQALAERQRSKLDAEASQQRKIQAELQSRLAALQLDTVRGNEKIDSFKLRMKWSEEELEQWQRAVVQKEVTRLSLFLCLCLFFSEASRLSQGGWILARFL